MFTILLHSSKTMKAAQDTRSTALHTPVYQAEADSLAEYLKTLSVDEIHTIMNLSEAMANKTKRLIDAYTSSEQPASALAAIDSFLGDIYSGLQVHLWTEKDRAYAHEHLFILSGLYGIVRALDAVQPYRLEMGYKLTDTAPGGSRSLYTFWGDKIVNQLPKQQTIINVSSHEYTRAVLPYLKNNPDFENSSIITPKFLTIQPKTSKPTFVTVHAKIARGAFARWIIQHRIDSIDQLKEFKEIGYIFDAALSTEDTPVFVAREFKGIGLSVRLT